VSITWLANYFFSKEDYSKYYGTVQFANSLGIAAGVPIIASALENLANTDLLWISLSLLGVLMGFLFIKSINGNQKEKAAAISSTIEATKRG
jgi:predicted MFS family arabinose efflux permease